MTRALLATAACLLAVAACGGNASRYDAAGLGTDAAALAADGAELTVLQMRYGAAYGPGAVTLIGELPLRGRPDPRLHTLAARTTRLTQPLSPDEQPLAIETESLSDSLPLPASIESRVVVDGRIVEAADALATLRQTVRLDGDSVVTTTLAADGKTPLYANRLASVDTVALTGRVADAPAELRRWHALAPLVWNRALHYGEPTFHAGATYTRLTLRREGDALFVGDCNEHADGATDPCPGLETVSSRMFPRTVLGQLLQSDDGRIRSVNGVRAWVSNQRLADPYGQLLTPSHAVFFEHGGQVWQGLLQTNGAVLGSRDDHGDWQGYTLRLNEAALHSLDAALTF